MKIFILTLEVLVCMILSYVAIIFISGFIDGDGLQFVSTKDSIQIFIFYLSLISITAAAIFLTMYQWNAARIDYLLLLAIAGGSFIFFLSFAMHSAVVSALAIIVSVLGFCRVRYLKRESIPKN